MFQYSIGRARLDPLLKVTQILFFGGGVGSGDGHSYYKKVKNTK